MIIHPPDIFVDYWQSVLKYYWFDKRPKPAFIKCKINLVEITQAKWYQLEFVLLVLPISFTTFCVLQEKQNDPNSLICMYMPHTIEFSLNDFPWIQRIQWIMTKPKSSMVTRDITHLTAYTLPGLVIQSVFSLLSWGRYLLPLTTVNRYQPTDSSGKFFFTTISSNISIVRCRMCVVTILLLDLITIHWIRWIQRK